MIEVELQRKDKIIDDLAAAQEAQYGMGSKRNALTGKGEQTHLVINLKRKIKELIADKAAQVDDIERLKRNIRSTRIQEVEAEIKVYMHECGRLRNQLEEVIKSKDTFADP